jgi:hypothetical protein
VNFKQSCGLFERGDALQERACPYGEYTHYFSAIRLQKGGLNSSCFFGGFPVAPKSPFGHTLLHSAKLNSDLMKKVITEKICDDFLSFIAFICVKHVEIGIGADACDTSEADLPDAEVAVIRRFIGILGEPHGA